MEAISKHAELWPRYFSDFILHKMKLESSGSGEGEGIAQKVLEAFFEQIHSQETLQRMVILHTYLHVYQLDLAKMAGMFRPLNKIQKVSVSAYRFIQYDSVAVCSPLAQEYWIFSPCKLTQPGVCSLLVQYIEQ